MTESERLREQAVVNKIAELGLVIGKRKGLAWGFVVGSLVAHLTWIAWLVWAGA